MNRQYIVIGAIFIGIVAASIAGVEWMGRSKQTAVSHQSPVEKQEGKNMNEKKQYSNPPAMAIDAAKTYIASITTSEGTMRVNLFASQAPNTVNNFVFLAREKFYDDTVFHRIISGFMIQGGDPEGTGRGGPGYRFADEPITEKYTRGTIAMANAGPNTNGSQFFLMHADYPLPQNYVIFGRIDAADAESLATLDKIAATPVEAGETGETSSPLEPVIVMSVTIEEK